MSKKYTIYHGGQNIEPADEKIIQIYHGNTLIWERAKTIGDYICAVFESADLEDHVFTTSGLIIPETLQASVSTEKYAYTLTGEQVAVSFPEDGAWAYIYADVPMYYCADTHEMLVYTADMSSYSRVSFSPDLDMDIEYADAKAIFVTHSTSATAPGSAATAFVANRDAYWHGVSQAYGGIVPLSLLYGILSSTGDAAVLDYATIAGAITSGGDYIVLDATPDGLICAENLRQPASLKIFATLSLRSADGIKIKDLATEEIEIFNPAYIYNATASMHRNPRTHHSFRIVGDLLVYLEEYYGGAKMVASSIPSGTQYDLDSNSLRQPYELDMVGDLQWFFGGTDGQTYLMRGRDWDNDSDPASAYFGLIQVPLTETDTGANYAIYNEYIRDGGAHYCDADTGDSYVIAKNTETEVYTLLRVGHGA